MALWGISTTAETSANNYAEPKYLGRYSSSTSLFEAIDRNRSPYDCFADNRGWIYRHYKTPMNSGLSTHYYDEILVSVAGLNTTGTDKGLGAATPVAVFFEDPNLASPISIGAGGTTGIGTGTTGYIHLVYDEVVYCSSGATLTVKNSGGSDITATAPAANGPVSVDVPGYGHQVLTFDGQVTNRIAFAFTVPNTGIGNTLTIKSSSVTGIITDAYDGGAVTKTFTADMYKNIAGAGTTAGVGIGTTTLTIKA
jgi:hypothetical protein